MHCTKASDIDKNVTGLSMDLVALDDILLQAMQTRKFQCMLYVLSYVRTHTHPFNGPFLGLPG